MDVRHAMTDYFASAHISSSVGDAMAKILDEGLSKLFIVDDASKLVGSIDESMLISRVFRGENWRNRSVMMYLDKHFTTVSPSEDLMRVLEKFRETGLPEFPVLDEGKLIGILTRRQLLRAILNRRSAKNEQFAPDACSLAVANR